MKYTFSLLFLFLFGNLSAQIKPDFFPEDANHLGHDIICYCKPGVRSKSRSRGLDLSYGFINSGDYSSEGEPFSGPSSSLKNLSQLTLKLKIPILLKERTKILLGYKYYAETFNLDQVGTDFKDAFGALDDKAFKSNSFSAILSHSLNEKNYTVFRFKYSSNGNYSGWADFGNQFAIYKFTGGFGIKKSEDFEWGIGLNYSNSFRRNSLLPFLIFNKNFNEKWGIESVFPVNVFFRRNLNEKSIALIGIEYNSESYLMEIDDTPVGNLNYAFNHSELISSISVERHISTWIWVNAKVGYQLNFSTDFESKSPNTIPFEAEPRDGLFLRLGLFLSPPDKKKK